MVLQECTHATQPTSRHRDLPKTHPLPWQVYNHKGYGGAWEAPDADFRARVSYGAPTRQSAEARSLPPYLVMKRKYHFLPSIGSNPERGDSPSPSWPPNSTLRFQLLWVIPPSPSPQTPIIGVQPQGSQEGIVASFPVESRRNKGGLTAITPPTGCGRYQTGIRPTSQPSPQTLNVHVHSLDRLNTG